VYDHKHFYFYRQGNPWTVRLQGMNASGREEIYVHEGKIDHEELDVGWHAIRSPYETNVTEMPGMPAHVIEGIKIWVDNNPMMTVNAFLKGLFGR
jgi:hypothetical protein